MKGRTSVAFSAYAKLNFKIIVVGHKSTGKTSLILRYVKNNFTPANGTTQTIQFYSSTVNVEADEVALQLWDTVGSDHFKNVMKSFYQQASCVLITYCDPSNAKNIVQNHILDINQFANQAVKIVIARTKCDEIPMYLIKYLRTQEQTTILNQFIQKQQNIILWRAVSAKSGEQVNNIFQITAKELFHSYQKQPAFKELVDPKKDSFLLDDKVQQKEEKKRHCCKG